MGCPMTIHAFWSYTRESEEQGGAALHEAMKASINGTFPVDVLLVRDFASVYGHPSGP